MPPDPQAPDLVLDRGFDAPPGRLISLTPRIRRMVAANPGPMTFTGTCTYVVGHDTVAIVDPGPDLPGHIEALLAALRGETVSEILVTHTHRDHCGAAAALKAATGARIIGCAPHAGADGGGETSLESAHDRSYAPDAVMAEGDCLRRGDFALTAVATPGHTGNHVSFALAEAAALFTGDHVMAWSTSVIIPPDGAMADYMASLEKLQRRDETIYWPGHGGPVRAPQTYLAALIHHRRAREAAILAALGGRPMTATQLVRAVYQNLAPALVGAARASVLAHLEDLAARGLIGMDAAQDDGEKRYRLA